MDWTNQKRLKTSVWSVRISQKTKNKNKQTNKKQSSQCKQDSEATMLDCFMGMKSLLWNKTCSREQRAMAWQESKQFLFDRVGVSGAHWPFELIGK